MVRKLFKDFYSKTRGPPRIRMQLAGTRGRRFYKIVACNVLDPKHGRHMEVLGSYVPNIDNRVRELRIRFTRLKFWLGVGAEAPQFMMSLLGHAGLIPPPPPRFGRRTCGREQELQNMMQRQIVERDTNIRTWIKSGFKIGWEQKHEVPQNDGLIEEEENIVDEDTEPDASKNTSPKKDLQKIIDKTTTVLPPPPEASAYFSKHPFTAVRKKYESTVNEVQQHNTFKPPRYESTIETFRSISNVSTACCSRECSPKNTNFEQAMLLLGSKKEHERELFVPNNNISSCPLIKFLLSSKQCKYLLTF